MSEHEHYGKEIQVPKLTTIKRDGKGWKYSNDGEYITTGTRIDAIIDHLLARAETAESEVAQVKALLDDANEMLASRTILDSLAAPAEYEPLSFTGEEREKAWDSALESAGYERAFDSGTYDDMHKYIDALCASHKLRRDAELAAAKARVVELEADVAICTERLHQVEKKLQSVASMHGADVEKISRLQNAIERLQKEKAALESRLSAGMPTRELTIAQPISLPSDMEIAQGLEDAYCKGAGHRPSNVSHLNISLDYVKGRLAQAAYVRSLVEGKAAQPTPEQPAPDREKVIELARDLATLNTHMSHEELFEYATDFLAAADAYRKGE